DALAVGAGARQGPALHLGAAGPAEDRAAGLAAPGVAAEDLGPGPVTPAPLLRHDRSGRRVAPVDSLLIPPPRPVPRDRGGPRLPLPGAQRDNTIVLSYEDAHAG